MTKSKPSTSTIRATRSLSLLPTYRPDPRVCSVCGVEVDPDDLPCSAWREHDEQDRPLASSKHIVFLGPSDAHAACRKALDDHPRLYSPIAGLPGSFPEICGPCELRRDLDCQHPDLKANGGPGLLVTLDRGLNGHVIACTRDGCIRPSPTARACAGRRVAGPETPPT